MVEIIKEKDIVTISKPEAEMVIKLSIPQSVDKIEKCFDLINCNNISTDQKQKIDIYKKAENYEKGVKEIQKLNYLKKEVFSFLSADQKKNIKQVDKTISKYEEKTFKAIKKEVVKLPTSPLKNKTLKMVKAAHNSLDVGLSR